MGRVQTAPITNALALVMRGMTCKQAAVVCGASYAGVYVAAKRNGLTLKHGNTGRPAGLRDDARAERMAGMYRQGVTASKIAAEYGISRERVRQILKKKGLTGKQGGIQLRTGYKREARSARLDAQCLLKWGISRAEHKQLRQDGILRAFESQRKNANLRGIEWSLSLVQWLTVWRASGRLAQRGRGKGKYVMSRIKDSGGYVIGNVHIQLSEENNREGIKKVRAAGTVAKHIGVWCLYPGSSKPWIAKVARTYIGAFATEEEAATARAAYITSNPSISHRGAPRGYTEIRRGNYVAYQVYAPGQGYIGTFKTTEAALAARHQAMSSGGKGGDPVSQGAARVVHAADSLAAR